jgi:hypothetical protein
MTEQATQQTPEIQTATPGQITFAAGKVIQGINAETARSEASRLIAAWCEAHPLTPEQKQERWNKRLERLRSQAASPAQQAIADRVTGGTLVLKNQAHAQAFMRRLGRRAQATATA